MYTAIYGVDKRRSVYLVKFFKEENGNGYTKIYKKLGSLYELVKHFNNNFDAMMKWTIEEARNEETKIHKSKLLEQKEIKRNFKLGVFCSNFKILEARKSINKRL